MHIEFLEIRLHCTARWVDGPYVCRKIPLNLLYLDVEKGFQDWGSNNSLFVRDMWVSIWELVRPQWLKGHGHSVVIPVMRVAIQSWVWCLPIR